MLPLFRVPPEPRGARSAGSGARGRSGAAGRGPPPRRPPQPMPPAGSRARGPTRAPCRDRRDPAGWRRSVAAWWSSREDQPLVLRRELGGADRASVADPGGDAEPGAESCRIETMTDDRERDAAMVVHREASLGGAAGELQAVIRERGQGRAEQQAEDECGDES